MNDPLSSNDQRQRRQQRREAQRRRTRRRRRAGLASVVAAAAAAVVGVALTRGGADGQSTANATTAATTPSTTPAAAATSTAGTSTAPADVAPSKDAQNAAVARLAALGVPLYRAGSRGKYVALTFDDGPGPYTEKTLDTLRSYNASATFFVNGTSMDRFPAGLAAEARAGVEVGNHTWSHKYLPGISPSEAWTETASTAAAIKKRSGHEVRLMRPPYGAHTADLRARLQSEGQLMVLWDIDSRDSLGASWDEMVSRLKKEIRPGSIVLFHENRGQTQMVINRLIPWLRKQGYQLVTVPELLAMDPPSLDDVRREAARRGDDTTGTRY